MSDKIKIGVQRDREGNVIGDIYIDRAKHERMEAMAVYDEALAECMAAREAAYAEKWPTPWDWNDDVMRRGLEAVQSDKQAIKDAFPKPELPE